MHPLASAAVYTSMPKKTKLKYPNEIIQNFNTQRAIQLRVCFTSISEILSR